MSKNSPDLQEKAGFVASLVDQARLAWRLLRDARVPGWVKLIPLGGLLYLLSPIDLLPDVALPGLGEIDDIVVLLLALKMFVDLSPSGVVREHLEQLLGRTQQSRADEESPSDSYIDAPYRVVQDQD
jgi:uncharacterized membrane protein YkvA (DUF1232 family)